MTLQQLRYLIAVAEFGSINAAAHNLFASQSNLSTAIKELETEFGITIFRRTNRGVTLTNEGHELLAYARQVVDQADMLEHRYSPSEKKHARLAISTQHYAFSVQAFIDVAESCASDEFDFVLRETSTKRILDDVRELRSDVGILYLDNHNRRYLLKLIDEAGLEFNTLFEARVHVFVGEHHPLAHYDIIAPEELANYPRYSFEQETPDSFYYSEEPLSYLPHRKNIRISDRGTLTNLLASHDGFTISTGVLSPEMHSGIVSIPLDIDEKMQVGYVVKGPIPENSLAHRYIESLERIIRTNPNVDSVAD